MKFTKMQGIGNDYVYVNCFEETVEDPCGTAKMVSDRHFGIGSDGLILIKPSRVADCQMDMYNLDGSRGAMCGNGIRCVGKYAYDHGIVDKTEIDVETASGIKHLSMKLKDGKVGLVTVDMGRPEQTSEIGEPITVDGKEYRFTGVSMGNPHAVVFMDGIKDMEIEKIGPSFEVHEKFPDRTNTEFVEIVDRGHVNMRVWERGSGETLACGTGACAAAVCAIQQKGMENKVVSPILIGAKSIGQYGGYESFIYKLLEYHREQKNIHYYVYCKANGSGRMDVTTLPGVQIKNTTEFTFYNADCYLIRVPQIGAAQAIFYDVKALSEACKLIRRKQIENPIVYIMACRIGPFMSHFVKKIHKLGGKVYLNPDGHEWMRAKWSAPIRKYWKESERLMVKHADLCICDSVNIETYIQQEYAKYQPKTTFIAYGSETTPSELDDNAPEFKSWLEKHGLKPNEYYMSCGRFVPENNFETMIREFMKSATKKDFAIITTANERFLNELEKKLHFKQDSRIKFVGTVYDEKLLKKIREKAYAYFHGHSVGGTNPSLLEALGSTKINLLYDVGFNREVAEDAALYWSLDKDSLAKLINFTDTMTDAQVEELGKKAKNRIKMEYSWKSICAKYSKVFMNM